MQLYQNLIKPLFVPTIPKLKMVAPFLVWKNLTDFGFQFTKV
jgi:hypothetical protein